MAHAAQGAQPNQAAQPQNAPARDDMQSRVSSFKFSQFDPKAEEWRYYIQRFDMELELQQLNGNDPNAQAAR